MGGVTPALPAGQALCYAVLVGPCGVRQYDLSCPRARRAAQRMLALLQKGGPLLPAPHKEGRATAQQVLFLYFGEESVSLAPGGGDLVLVGLRAGHFCQHSRALHRLLAVLCREAPSCR